MDDKDDKLWKFLYAAMLTTLVIALGTLLCALAHLIGGWLGKAACVGIILLFFIIRRCLD